MLKVVPYLYIAGISLFSELVCWNSVSKVVAWLTTQFVFIFGDNFF
jgi:hypothetical protein